MTSDNPQRIDLEAKVAFLERSVELMAAEIREQNREIARLEERIDALSNQGEDGEVGPHHDPPPHYGR